MKRLCVILSALVLLIMWTSPVGAAPTTIVFDGLPASPFDMYEQAGVTFTAVGGGQLQEVTTPNGTPGITGVGVGDPLVFPALRADIAGGASLVSVDLGKFQWGDETIFLEIYDASDNLLDNLTSVLTAPGAGMENLSLETPTSVCISYVIFGAKSSSGSTVSADNFMFEPCQQCPVIPAPAAIVLGMIGTGLVGHLRRRRAL